MLKLRDKSPSNMLEKEKKGSLDLGRRLGRKASG